MSIANSSAWVIALDVGGSSVKSAAVAQNGPTASNLTITSIDSSGNAESILTTLAQIITFHLAQADASNLLGVTFGFPGPFDYTGGICLIKGLTKFESIYGVNIREAIQARVPLGNRAVVFRNDAEAAIIGEAIAGAGRPFRRLLGITLGTGMGSSFVVDGHRVESGEGVPSGGWLYPVPFRGSRADDCFSRRGLESRLHVAGASGFDVQEAAEAARRGNQVLLHVFHEFGADLGSFLDPFARQFRAEAVLVLGGISGAIDLFATPLRQALSVPALAGERDKDAPLLGAADLLFT